MVRPIAPLQLPKTPIPPQRLPLYLPPELIYGHLERSDNPPPPISALLWLVISPDAPRLSALIDAYNVWVRQYMRALSRIQSCVQRNVVQCIQEALTGVKTHNEDLKRALKEIQEMLTRNQETYAVVLSFACAQAPVFCPLTSFIGTARDPFSLKRSPASGKSPRRVSANRNQPSNSSGGGDRYTKEKQTAMTKKYAEATSFARRVHDRVDALLRKIEQKRAQIANKSDAAAYDKEKRELRAQLLK